MESYMVEMNWSQKLAEMIVMRTGGITISNAIKVQVWWQQFPLCWDQNQHSVWTRLSSNLTTTTLRWRLYICAGGSRV